MYKISFYTCRITFPISFARHSWVVLESPEYGENRYEVHAIRNPKTKNYFYVNNQPKEQGMSYFSLLFFWFSKQKFKAKKIFEVEGAQYKDIVLMLEKEIQEYPYKEKYFLYPGPNSNSFTNWVIQKAGLAKRVQLPWNAFGKKFLIKA